MSYFIIIRGPAGVGKTMVASHLAKLLHGFNVSIDSILAKNGLNYVSGEPCVPEYKMLAANKIIIPIAQEKLAAGHIVIFDGNFYHKSQLDDLITRLQFPHFIYTLTADLAVCLARNKQRTHPLDDRAVKDVFELVAKFDYGIMVDTNNKIIEKIVQEIITRQAKAKMFVEETNEDKVFKSLDLSNLSLADHSFSNCTFENCTFIKSVWSNAKFHSCTFTCCNISFAPVVGCFLQDVIFNECKLVGIEFYKCNKTFFCVTITQSILLNCNFSDLGMQRASFHKSQLKECHFTNTQLSETDFTDADLEGSVFHKCKLDKADFRAAKNYVINLQTNTAKKAKFSYPEVITLLKSFDIVINE